MAGTLGLVLALPAVSSADPPWTRDPDRYGYGYDRSPAFSAGYDRGYREGMHNGREDREHHRRFDVYRDGDSRDTDKGYRHDYGPRSVYRDGYRSGYARGYRSGYGRSGYGYRYDRGTGYYDRDGRRHPRGDRDVTIYEEPW